MTTPPLQRPGILLIVAFVAIALPFPMLFANRDVQIDEGWIGQQAWHLAHDGSVTTELFRDCPPLDGEIVVYHKLLVWIAAAVISIFGWGLLPLRAISAVAGVCTLVMLYRSRLVESKRTALLAIAVVMYVPLYWTQMSEFRPEMLVVVLGMGSLVLLHRARNGGRFVPAMLAGVLAGLAALAHAFGMAYIVAGCAALLFERRWKQSAVFVAAGIAAFLPYVSAYFFQRDLFLAQTIYNQVTATRLIGGQYHPLVNLISEHKRLWRRVESIGISTWMVIALAMVNRPFVRRHAFDFMYTAALLVVIGASPLDKNPRYMIPLVPLFALTIARVWDAREALILNLRGRLAFQAFRIWGVVFFLFGAYAFGVQVARPPRHQIETNAVLAPSITPGAVVMAPFDFVYMQQGRFVIQSWDATRETLRGDTSVARLERRADSVGVRYLIVDSLAAVTWRLEGAAWDTRFQRYELLASLPGQHRWLLRNRGGG